MQISASIITYNEERQIARAIKSLVGVCDELILIDSNSTDKTLEIVNTFKSDFPSLKVQQRNFQGFTDQKNYASSLTTHDWILNIDADEELSSDLRSEIIRIKTLNVPYHGFRFNRLTQFCGKWIYHCGWYPDDKIRLWNKHYGQWEGEKIHEKVVMLPKTQTQKITGDLLHYSYQSISDHVLQAEKFSNISADVAIDQGKKIYFLKDVVLNPGYTFIYKFFIKKGFLDGKHGFLVCILSAFANLLKYSKIWTKQLR